jgi:hypothetical protein
MTKPQPGSDGAVRLEVSGRYATFRSGEPLQPRYRVVEVVRDVSLADVQWADWARDGTLLVATTAGQLETRTAGSWTAAGSTVVDLTVSRSDTRRTG